jgi:uncharacterized protein YijF (DUF1287 family)
MADAVPFPCLALAGTDCAFTPTTATTDQYDGLSRQIKVTDSGGGYVQFQYPGNDVLQTIGPATTRPATEALKQNVRWAKRAHSDLAEDDETALWIGRLVGVGV